MLNTPRIMEYLDGCPFGPWVDGAISSHRVPRLKGETIACNLSDRDVMRLWGAFRDRGYWEKGEWAGYLKQDAYTDFADFRRWLIREFSR